MKEEALMGAGIGCIVERQATQNDCLPSLLGDGDK